MVPNGSITYVKANIYVFWLFWRPRMFPWPVGLVGGYSELSGVPFSAVCLRQTAWTVPGFASLALDYLTPKITKETGKVVDKEYFEVNLIVSQKTQKNSWNLNVLVTWLQQNSTTRWHNQLWHIYSEIIVANMIADLLKSSSRHTQQRDHLIWLVCIHTTTFAGPLINLLFWSPR